MKLRPNFSLVWGIILVTVFGASGCGILHVDGNSRSEIAAFNLVVDQISPYFKANPGGLSVEFVMGDLDKGSAVLLVRRDDKLINGAFWVCDGEVFSVNNAARTIAPEFDAAPAAITYERVIAVVH